MPLFARDPVAVQGRDIRGDCRGWLPSATPYAASSSGSCIRRRYAFIHSITGVSQAFSSLAAGKLSASEIVDLDLELGSRNSGATAHRK
jgi:hypothetical protein